MHISFAKLLFTLAAAAALDGADAGARPQRSGAAALSVLELRGGPQLSLPYDVRTVAPLSDGHQVLTGQYDSRACYFAVVNINAGTVSAVLLPSASDLITVPTVAAGLFVAGTAFGSMDGAQAPDERPLFVIRLDGHGDLIWAQGTEPGVSPAGMLPSPDGSVLVVASRVTQRSDMLEQLERGSLREALAFRLSHDGDLQWVKGLREAGEEGFGAESLAPASDGGAYILATGGRLIHLTAEGEVAWARRLSFPSGTRGNLWDVAVAPWGVVVGGVVSSAGPEGTDAFAVALDGSGNLLWASAVDAGPLDEVEHAAVTAGGSVLLTGSTQQLGATLDDRVEGPRGFLVKLSAEGELADACSFGSGDGDLLGQAIETGAEIAIVGSVASGTRGRSSVVVRVPLNAPCPANATQLFRRVSAQTRPVRLEAVPIQIMANLGTVSVHAFRPMLQPLVGSDLRSSQTASSRDAPARR